MTIYLKDEVTSKAVRKLAKLRGTTLTEAVRMAVMRELSAETNTGEDAALRKLQEQFAERPSSGKIADKEFYDSLYED